MDEMLTAPVRSREVVSLPEPGGDVIAYALAEIGVRTVFPALHFEAALDAALSAAGPQLLEVDMTTIRSYGYLWS